MLTDIKGSDPRPWRRLDAQPEQRPDLLVNAVMATQNSPETGRPRSTAALFGHPIHPMLVPFPIACFIGALVTDIVYARSANMMWANFSVWLITAGLLLGALAAIAGVTDFLGDRRVRRIGTAWAHGGINIAVWVIEFFNAFVHSRDGWTSVVPTGLVLSAVSVALLGISGWLGGGLVFRHGVGTPR